MGGGSVATFARPSPVFPRPGGGPFARAPPAGPTFRPAAVRVVAGRPLAAERARRAPRTPRSGGRRMGGGSVAAFAPIPVFAPLVGGRFAGGDPEVPAFGP